MKRRTIAVLVLVALVLIGGWMLARPDRETPSLDTDDATSSTASPATLTGTAQTPQEVPATAPEAKPAVVREPPAPATERADTVSIRVRVLDENDAAVEGVEIRERFFATSSGLLERRVLGRSNHEGWADLRVPEGKIVLVVGDSGKWHCSEVLVVNGDTEDLVFHVVEMVTLRGTVLTFTGEPSPGSRVTVVYLDRSGVRGSPVMTHAEFGPTDADGHFTMCVPPYVTELTLMTFTKGGGMVQMTFDLRKKAEIILQLRKRILIRGSISDENGKPVTGFSVDALPLDGGETADLSRSKDEFGLGVTAPGRYLLLVAPTPGAGLAHPKPIEVVAPVEGLRIVCPRGSPLSGTLVGERAEGFRAVWTRHRGEERRLRIEQETKATASGNFALNGLTPGDTLLYVFRDGDERYGLVERVSLPGKNIKVPLQSGLEVKGRVTGYTGRHGFDLYVGLTWRGPTRWGMVQDDGSFSVTGLPPGTYGVRWWRGDVQEATEQEIESGGAAIDVVLPPKALTAGAVPPK